MKRDLLKFICTGAMVVLGINAWAQSQTIISTVEGSSGINFNLANGMQFGNEVNLNQNNYSLNGFNFEYYSPTAFLSTSVGVDVRFYLNDGAANGIYSNPNSIFFDSGWFYNNPSGTLGSSANGNNIQYTNSDLYSDSLVNLPAGFLMPTNFTVVISFTNLDNASKVSIPLANTVTNYASSVLDSYWLNTGAGWEILTNTGYTANNMLFTMTGTVPEPSIMYLGGVGSLLLFGAMKLKRKR